MAEAIVRGVIERGVSKAPDIIVSEPLEARRTALVKTYGVGTAEDNLSALEDRDAVVLAVKPQVMPYVLKELQGRVGPNQVVVSIAAGVKLDTLQSGLGHDVLVRAMPNTPAQIGRGITMWTTAEGAGPEAREAGAQILQALGEEIYVEDEKYLDMATALSGGGPAYTFLIIESLIDAGVHVGLSRDISEKLVLETVLGSAMLYKESGAHAAALKNMVTSPGGTTAEALLVLEEGGLRGLFIRAVVEAYHKAQRVG